MPDPSSADRSAPAASVTTPRPWPEGAMPTAEQLADWIVACTPDERQRWAEAFVRASDQASRCFVELHDGLKEQLAAASKASGEAYSRGWRDAVAAALEAVDNA